MTCNNVGCKYFRRNKRKGVGTIVEFGCKYSFCKLKNKKSKR